MILLIERFRPIENRSDEDKSDAKKYIFPFLNFREFVFEGLKRASEEQRHFRPQRYWITDDNGKIVTNFLGRTERLQEGFDFVCEITGWTKTKVEILNQSSREGIDYTDDEMRKVVKEIYMEDFKMIEKF